MEAIAGKLNQKILNYIIINFNIEAMTISIVYATKSRRIIERVLTPGKKNGKGKFKVISNSKNK